MRKPKHKFKKLLDAYPLNTVEAKEKLREDETISLDKINRWYRDPESTISTLDQFCLQRFFGLQSINDLYEAQGLKSAKRPIKN